MIISYAAKEELIELVEDTIEYFCDQEIVSGQTAWTAVSALAEAKLAQINHEKKINLSASTSAGNLVKNATVKR
ncbi:hypothetical protein [uncultured phage MedDCM-OCT-S04-C348]|nr:hypothetical protein [uncultured phage MedDCM-OCT-S04-C348]